MSDGLHKDARALPLLMDVMTAAGRHDLDACLRLLDEAEALLGDGFHRSRIEISNARGKARDHDFEAVWGYAWAATTGLTWAFPPDPSRCPPMPTTKPYAATSACPCGTGLPPAARFCTACGQERPTE